MGLFQDDNINFKTTSGNFDKSWYVYLKYLVLPEFFYTWQVNKVKYYVFDVSYVNPDNIYVLSYWIQYKWFGGDIHFLEPVNFKKSIAMYKFMELIPAPSAVQTDMDNP